MSPITTGFIWNSSHFISPITTGFNFIWNISNFISPIAKGFIWNISYFMSPITTSFIWNISMFYLQYQYVLYEISACFIYNISMVYMQNVQIIYQCSSSLFGFRQFQEWTNGKTKPTNQQNQISLSWNKTYCVPFSQRQIRCSDSIAPQSGSSKTEIWISSYHKSHEERSEWIILQFC